MQSIRNPQSSPRNDRVCIFLHGASMERVSGMASSSTGGIVDWVIASCCKGCPQMWVLGVVAYAHGERQIIIAPCAKIAWHIKPITAGHPSSPRSGERLFSTPCYSGQFPSDYDNDSFNRPESCSSRRVYLSWK